MAAQPHRNALLRLLVVIGCELAAALTTAAVEQRFNAVTPAAGRAEVGSVERAGIV
jgi:hypothetical protein